MINNNGKFINYKMGIVEYKYIIIALAGYWEKRIKMQFVYAGLRYAPTRVLLNLSRIRLSSRETYIWETSILAATSRWLWPRK